MKKSKKKYLLALCASAMLLGLVRMPASARAQVKSDDMDSKIENVARKAVGDAKSAEIKVEEDFDAAMKSARAEGKKLMLEFSGSKWCPPCKMLNALVLKTKKFADYAEKKLKVVLADFDYSDGPVSKNFAKRHAELAEEFQIKGFPTIIVIDPESGKSVRFEGMMFSSPDELIGEIEAFSNANPAPSPKSAQAAGEKK